MQEKAKNDHASDVIVYELAGLVNRLMANIIDNFLLFIPLFIIQMILFSSDPPLPFHLINVVILAVPVAYQWYFLSRRDGQTPGKFAMGIRVIRTDGAEISDVDALIRGVGYYVSNLVFSLGFIWALFDKNNQTWHDKMARTYVVRTDEKRKMVEIPI